MRNEGFVREEGAEKACSGVGGRSVESPDKVRSEVEGLFAEGTGTRADYANLTEHGKTVKHQLCHEATSAQNLM